MIAQAWIGLQQWSAERLDSLVPPSHRRSANLEVGERGEWAAFFALRRHGYTLVASRWTSAKMRGDVDLIGWDGDWLCFIEVKTRTARDTSPAESAVDRDKQRMLRNLAAAYLKSFPQEKRRLIPVRFDIAAVYLLPGGTQFELMRGAFPWR